MTYYDHIYFDKGFIRYIYKHKINYFDLVVYIVKMKLSENIFVSEYKTFTLI